MEDLTASQQAMIKKLGEIAPITKWEIADKIVENLIKRLIDNSEVDLQKVFTNFELCREIVGHIPDLSGTINVVANLEFVYILIRVGVDAERISFSSPDPDKRRMALTLFGVGNVYKYNNILGDNGDMPKFDFIPMNPAYENNLDQQFLMQATQYIKPTGMIACILPTTNLAGKQSQAFRQKLCSVINVHRADLLPTNTFRAITTNLSKKMILATAVLYLSPMPMDHAIITRQLNGTKFTWIDDPCSGDDIRLYYDNVGKEIWEICSKYHTKFDTSVNANYTRQILSGPNVNIGAKTEQQYLGDSLKLQHLSGAKIWTGKDVDPNGTYQRVYEHAAKSRTGKRFVYKTKTPEQTINLGRWMDSKLFGILLSMTGTDSNVSKTTVGQIPFVVLDGVFDTDQDFTHAVYLELGISNETHIRWINEFGN